MHVYLVWFREGSLTSYESITEFLGVYATADAARKAMAAKVDEEDKRFSLYGYPLYLRDADECYRNGRDLRCWIDKTEVL